MRMRIASSFALSLALGTAFCSGTAPTPRLDTCCILTASDGTVDCFCGVGTEGAVVSTVVVSGSTCTVTFTTDAGSMGDGGGTGDGGGGQQATGYPPAAVTDCMNLVGH